MNKENLNWIKDNWLISIVVFIIIFFIVKSIFADKDNSHLESTINKEKVAAYFISPEENDNGRGYHIKGTEEGYTLEVEGINLGEITGDNILQFVTNLKKGGSFSFAYNKNQGSSKNLGIVIDNTYSYWGNELDKSLAQKHFNDAMYLIKNTQELGIGSTIQVGRMFVENYGDKTKKEKMNEKVFIFHIRDLKTNISVSGENVDKIDYIEEYHSLLIPNDISMSIGKSKGGCVAVEEDIEHEFNCDSIDDLLSQIKKIYENNYKISEAIHQGTYLLDFLKNQNFYRNDAIYVFTDGEFQIAPSSQNTLTSINNKYKLKESLIFDELSYENLSYFTKYRNTISPILNNTLVKCEKNQDIIFQGFNKNNSSFIDFTEDVYEKIFKGCKISFKS